MPDIRDFLSMLLNPQPQGQNPGLYTAPAPRPQPQGAGLQNPNLGNFLQTVGNYQNGGPTQPQNPNMGPMPSTSILPGVDIEALIRHATNQNYEASDKAQMDAYNTPPPNHISKPNIGQVLASLALSFADPHGNAGAQFGNSVLGGLHQKDQLEQQNYQQAQRNKLGQAGVLANKAARGDVTLQRLEAAKDAAIARGDKIAERKATDDLARFKAQQDAEQGALDRKSREDIASGRNKSSAQKDVEKPLNDKTSTKAAREGALYRLENEFGVTYPPELKKQYLESTYYEDNQKAGAALKGAQKTYLEGAKTDLTEAQKSNVEAKTKAELAYIQPRIELWNKQAAAVTQNAQTSAFRARQYADDVKSLIQNRSADVTNTKQAQTAMRVGLSTLSAQKNTIARIVGNLEGAKAKAQSDEAAALIQAQIDAHRAELQDIDSQSDYLKQTLNLIPAKKKGSDFNLGSAMLGDPKAMAGIGSVLPPDKTGTDMSKFPGMPKTREEAMARADAMIAKSAGGNTATLSPQTKTRVNNAQQMDADRAAGLERIKLHPDKAYANKIRARFKAQYKQDLGG